jgi:O-antigen/teichoic acid export membrane protein
MSSDVRRLGKHTVVYGAGYVLTRMIPFFLLPFYTHHINRADLGVVGLIYAAIGFLNIIYHYGLDSAFLRFFSKKESPYRPEQVFSTALISLFVTGIFFTAMLYGGAGFVSRLLLQDDAYAVHIRWASLVLFLDTLINIPLHYLRMVNKPLHFTTVNLLNVTVNFAMNILFIRYLHKDIEFVFISNVIASAFTLLLLSPLVVKNWQGKPPPGLWKALVRFGLPFIPGGLASMVMELIGRYMLKWYTDLDTVGLYFAGYKLGIFMLVVITAYKFAWQPFFLNKGNDPDAPQLFARIMTYFLALLLLLFLAVSFFIREIITFELFGISFFGSDYWGAEPVVPVILAAYIFLGIYMNLLPAIYFSERTGVIPIISGSAALVNVLFNMLLIPKSGMMGAAWATFIAYAWMAFFTFILTHKWYPVPYQWAKLWGLTASALLIFFLRIQFFPESILFRAGLILAFIGSLFLMNIISPKQLREFKK